MAGEIEAVEKVVWTYLDGLYEGDTGKLAQAFHEVSHLYSVSDGGVADLPREKWFEFVKGRASPKSKGLDAHRPHRVDRLLRAGDRVREARVLDPPALLHRLPDPAQAQRRLEGGVQDLPHGRAGVAAGTHKTPP